MPWRPPALLKPGRTQCCADNAATLCDIGGLPAAEAAVGSTLQECTPGETREAVARVLTRSARAHVVNLRIEPRVQKTR